MIFIDFIMILRLLIFIIGNLILYTFSYATPLQANVTMPSSYTYYVNQPIRPVVPVSGSGGSGFYTYSISPDLPNGLILNPSTGEMSGTPDSSSSNTSYMVIVDDGISSASQSFNIVVESNLPLQAILNIPSSNTYYVNQPITSVIPVSGSGGSGSYTYSSPDLPDGLILDPITGEMSGTPNSISSNTSYTVTVNDGSSTASQSFDIVVLSPRVTLSGASTPFIYNTGTNISFTPVTASGGSGSYRYSMPEGVALPPWLTIDASTGTISGTPSSSVALGNYGILVADSLDSVNVARGVFLLAINDPSISISPRILPRARLNESYSQTISVSGGTGPYTFALYSGSSLPSGFSLSSDGVISGSSSTASSVEISITATDSGSPSKVSTISYTFAVGESISEATIQQMAVQVSSVQIALQGQMSNINSRLESLRLDQFGSSDLSVSIQQPYGMIAQESFDNDVNMCRSYLGNSKNRGLVPLHCKEHMNNLDNKQIKNLAHVSKLINGFWVGGDLSYGAITLQETKNKFSTSGLSMGIDRKVYDKLTLGSAFGIGWNNVKVGSDGTKTDSINPSFSLYGMYSPIDKLFMNMILGYGYGSLKNKRFDSGNGVIVSGTRKANSVFGSISTNLVLSLDSMKFLPFIRGDFNYSKLGEYSEEGSNSALTYKDLTSRGASFSTGSTFLYDMVLDSGVLSPSLKLSYSYNYLSSGLQTLYNTPTNLQSVVVPGSIPTNAMNSALGLRYTRKAGTLYELIAGYSFGTKSYHAVSISGVVRVPF
jgi:hypothetical protein